MKVLAKTIPAMLVLLLIAGWLITALGLSRTATSTADVIAYAEESVDEGLYAQAIEQYGNVLSLDSSLGIWQRIEEIYELYYEEEPNDEVRDLYIYAMTRAAEAYPTQAEFWEKACDLYLADGQPARAYDLLRRASVNGASSDRLSAIAHELTYTTTLGNRLYYNIKSSLNGFTVADTGAEYQVLGDTGTCLVDGYQFIGPINAEGMGIYVNDIDTRMLDNNEIARGRYSLKVLDAGEIDSESGLVPVCLEDGWRYLNTATGDLLDGVFDEAGCFSRGKAAVREGESWHLIGVDGAKVSDNYADFKLDLHGSWIHAGVAIAKVADSYEFYDESLTRISDFSCDDIDLYAEDGAPIAFKQEDKWGFVGPDGTVVCAPSFDCAKSFSNGFAAIREGRTLWGYVNEGFDKVIDCEYTDALYFNASLKSWVGSPGGAYQLLGFTFE